MRAAWLRNAFTVKDWLEGYSRSHFTGDLIAGLTVGVMLIPQSMAYAMLAGLPPVYGLYASLVPLLIYPLFGTARQVAIGIVALDMLIVQAALNDLQPATDGEALALALALAAMAGSIHLVMGLLRLGFVVDFLSRPVIAGFMFAAPLIIGLSQVHHLLGLDIGRSSDVLTLMWSVVTHVGDMHVVTAVMGVAAVVMLLVLRRLHPLFPRALLTISLATALVYGLEGEGVQVVGSFEGGLPSIGAPWVSLSTLRALAPSALALAAVQLISLASLGKSLAVQGGYHIEPNRELVALGWTNIGGSVFGSCPVSVSFSRTAVNVGAGGMTPLSNVFAAVVVGAGMLFLSPVLAWIPTPALAALIMVSAFGMLSLREFRLIFGIVPEEGYVALTTMGVTVLVGIQEGVLFGVLASMAVMLFKQSRPKVVELGHIPGTPAYRDPDHCEGTLALESMMVLRIDGSLTFNNAESVRRRVLERVENHDEPLDAVVLDARGINYVDATAADELHALLDEIEEMGVSLYLSNAKKAVRDVLRRAQVMERLASGAAGRTTAEVVSELSEPPPEG